MNTIIKSPNIEVTEAIKLYIEKKMNSLERPLTSFLNEEDVQENPIESRKDRIEVIWEIGTESTGSKKGLFFCKVIISIPGKNNDIIARAISGDLYSAIGEVKDITIKQLVNTKEKPDSLKKRAARKFKRLLNFDSAAHKDEGERVREEGR